MRYQSHTKGTKGVSSNPVTPTTLHFGMAPSLQQAEFLLGSYEGLLWLPASLPADREGVKKAVLCCQAALDLKVQAATPSSVCPCSFISHL